VRRAALFLIVAFILLSPARADAGQIVTINIKNGRPTTNPAQIGDSDLIVWRNQDTVAHEIEFEQGAVAVPAGQTSEPLAIRHSFQYKIDNGATLYGVVVGGPPIGGPPPPAPPSTTPSTVVNAPPPPAITTPTTDVTTTTTAAPEPSTTTTETSTTTTTTAAPPTSTVGIAIGPTTGGRGTSPAAPLLTLSSIVVACLAGYVGYLWRRSVTRDGLAVENAGAGGAEPVAVEGDAEPASGGEPGSA
jgi:hypothetical protein